jgi:hypothetical protein
MRALDFMVLGAQKSGTSALAAFLGEHPGICISDPKEVHVFDADEASLTLDHIDARYASAFAGKEHNYALLGEATPIYMYFTDIARQLHNYNPKLKILIVLRNPVERAYSHYCMERERGNEHRPFWIALALEWLRLKKDSKPRDENSAHRLWSYRNRGYYSHQLEAIYKVFSRDQVHVISNEALRDRQDATLDNIFDFLNVPRVVIPGRLVFTLNTDVREVSFCRFLLRIAYRRETRRLQKYVDFPTDAWR